MRKPFSAALTAAALLAATLLGSAAVHSDEPAADPFEGLNRRVFAFNEFMDRNILKPLGTGYQKVAPQFVDDGVSNFFNNLGEVPSFVNHLLQWRIPEAGTDGGRFAVNSTVGLLGVFDVASRMGIAQNTTDFGITLGRWGVGAGPYLVLPLMGPSTLRDGVGQAGDFYLQPVNHIERDTTRWPVRGLEVVDLRADLLAVEELITGDRYVFLRNLYLQRREFLVTGELPEDDFGDEEF